jgi:carboxyl-terminal processing protease
VLSLARFRLQLLVVFTACFWNFSAAQTGPNFKNDLYQLKKLLSEHHVSPREVDEKFSRDVVQNLLTTIDPYKLYFTDDEVLRIVAHQSKITTDINNNTSVFLPFFQEIVQMALTRAMKNIIAISQQAVNLDLPETLYADTTWAADESMLQKRFGARMKLNILTQLELNRSNEEIGMEQKCKQVAQVAMRRSVDKILQHSAGYENAIGNIFLRAILNAYDPHSLYMSPVEMQNFVASLSSQGFHFGFMLEEDLHGNVLIKGIVPGSPAWKCGEIHTGDIIDGLAWRGKQKTDAALLSINEIEAILMESNHNVLDLYLRSSMGAVKKVMLKKELQSIETNIVRSAILVTESKMGYISLPDFYSNWEEAGGTQCANDVAKEIIRLKKENIKGLVLDLRFNGGGSLEEAVAMAGIFIDAGPMGLLRGKNGEPITFKDFNRGTVWDGPLIVMVNGSSASASEFVAAALQDYNRAIIVGTKTYGKGTAQNIFSLAPGKPIVDFSAVSANNKTGYATITTDRAYRISGKSVQYTGVTPDITISEPNDYTEYQESNLAFALKPDVIFKKVYFQPLPPITLNPLSVNSLARMERSVYFKEVDHMKDLLQQSRIVKGIPLSKADFKKRFAELSASIQAVEKLLIEETGIFNVEFVPADVQLMQMDEYFSELNTYWSENLKSDYQLGETANIMSDFIRLSKTP